MANYSDIMNYDYFTFRIRKTENCVDGGEREQAVVFTLKLSERAGINLVVYIIFI